MHCNMHPIDEHWDRFQKQQYCLSEDETAGEIKRITHERLITLHLHPRWIPPIAHRCHGCMLASTDHCNAVKILKYDQIVELQKAQM